MSSVFTIKEIIRSKNGTPVLLNGEYLCRIQDSAGLPQIVPVSKDIVEGIYNPENHNAEPNPQDLIVISQSEMGKSSETSIEDPEGIQELIPKKEWTEEQTKHLLDLYYEYLHEVGPMKKFKLKKHMWMKISVEINTEFQVDYSYQNVENRYKTVLKRKKKAINNNSKSGEKRVKVEYEDELKNIMSVDDSIQPKVLKGQNECVMKEVINKKEDPSTYSKGKKDTVISYLKKINEEKKCQRELLFKEKEDNKERRHQEKMDLLKEFLNRK